MPDEPKFPSLAEVLAAHRWSIITHRCRCEDPATMGEWAQHVSDAWREACTIRTVGQLNELPVGSVIRAIHDPDNDHEVLEKLPPYGNWHLTGIGSPLSAIQLAEILARRGFLLIWHPDWEHPNA